VDRVRFIHRGQAAGLTLQKVRQILAIHDRGEAPCGRVRQVLNTRLEQVHAQVAELVALEGHLQSLLTARRARRPPNMRIPRCAGFWKATWMHLPMSNSPSRTTKTGA
jgi:DNA-binding transcriptional MerR regulator